MSIQKVVIFTLRTRGDVQPYIYFARALKGAGFLPTIATHPCWRSLVEQAGVGFSPIGPDIDISRRPRRYGENPPIGSSGQSGR